MEEGQIVLSPTAIYWIIFIGIAIASWAVSAALERKFKKYSQQPLKLTGREVAEKMLRDNDIYDVKVTSISGQLTEIITRPQRLSICQKPSITVRT